MRRTIACPKCGVYLDIEEEMFGTTMMCAGCRNVIVPFQVDLVAATKDRDAERRSDSTRDPDAGRRSSRDEDDDGDSNRRGFEDDESVIVTPARRPGTGLGVASLAVGICSIVLGVAAWFVCCPFIQTPMAVVAIGLGYCGLNTQGRGQALAGMICGTIAAFMSLLVMVTFGIAFSTLGRAGTAGGTATTAVTTAPTKMNTPNAISPTTKP